MTCHKNDNININGIYILCTLMDYNQCTKSNIIHLTYI